MKTQLVSSALLSIAILTSSFAYSNDAKPIKSATKEIAIKSGFQKISVGQDFQLILTQAAGKSTILVTGDESLIQSVTATIDKGVLSVTSKKSLKNKKIRIYVPVNNLTFLELDRNASVTSEGIVKLEGLKVLVHEGSKVNLNILGNFQVESDDDCDFVYEKNETKSVVFIHE
jgi:hypothetical protein